jgi:hypothetical protein
MPRVPIDPNRIFRVCEARDLFGYGPTILKAKIKSGAIPAPIRLSPPPSRAFGWYGYVIQEHRENVAKQQEAWAKDAENYYQPEGGRDVRTTNKSAAAAVKKPAVAKVKGLKRPTRVARRQKSVGGG